MNGGYRVRVVDADGLKAWRPWPQAKNGEPGWFSPAAAAKAKCEQTGETVLCIFDDDRFSWVCPGCGGLTGGSFGPEPVSGWDNPRWMRTGPDDALTLAPSLGCPVWRAGKCDGHWWLHDGRLVLA